MKFFQVYAFIKQTAFIAHLKIPGDRLCNRIFSGEEDRSLSVLACQAFQVILIYKILQNLVQILSMFVL